MAYKLAYIEDLDPGSIMSDLSSVGFELTHIVPQTFEKLIEDISADSFDAILLDFRLRQGDAKAKFDAPTIAQTYRTHSATTGKHIPIVLISSEKIISDFYADFTSNDLFDLSIVKEELQKNLGKYASRIADFIESYKSIEINNFDINKILGNPVSESFVDYRIMERVNNTHHKKNVYKISRLIFNTLVRSIGPLIGEDVLASRLGVKKSSDGWVNLRDSFGDAKYKGVYSQSYDRWWARHIEQIADEKFKIPSLRRLKAQDRVASLEAVGFKNLIAAERLKFAESTNFWTICKEKIEPLDAIDGLELVSKEAIAWADMEYLSLLAAMESSPLNEFIKPDEMERFKEFQKTVK